MSNNTHWRGRGGGGRGNNSNRGRNDQSSGSSSILSRLGPTNAPINTSTNVPTNNNPPSNQGNGRAFSKNNRRGRGGGSGSNTRFSNEFIEEDVEMKPDNSNGITVTVKGYPPRSEEKLLTFLMRKSKTPWQPVHVAYENEQVLITVADEKAASSLCRMNNYTFLGSNVLEITRNGQGAISSKPSTSIGANNQTNGRPSYIVEFLHERWNAQTGYLDMDELPPTSHNITIVINRLLTEAQQLFGNSLITLSFARNKLWSVVPVSKVPDLFPNLRNLSLQDNDIAEYRSLDRLANRLNQLQELVLSGNPIQRQSDYRSEVAKRFPSVQFLDFQPVQENLRPVQADLPVPVQSSFFDQDNSRIAAQDMLSKFFPLFDTDRKSLIDLYDTQSTFSVVFSKGNFNQENSWGSSKAKPSQRMIVGNENIIKKLCSLPITIHDLSRPENFVTDAWQTQGTHPNYPVILFLTVHGEFNEAPFGVPLSFDRSFLVAPSTPGSRAQAAGWSYVILSDSLIVRQFSCKPTSLITV
ncbi:hypothetical protein G6F57_009923 [Rhizopus arrhizus]|nr:hypothetical protein G6F24_006404 [Rhizopus arrhizus]KAG1411258.1 hypothetical protein G6F58_008655 [Rhizopus delemar]KAG0791223.1 hypothetical protein G6F21_005239 [Rhizopus arrhizus]KAG0798185.1 hypothetical protein G6F22_004473 [Rhizopus arrhizus]KAG0807534.1 hypothetical protein G6F20_010287 [Rhizopus arrhizus]